MRQHILLCGLVGQVFPGPFADRVIVAQCSKCGQDVWVSPSSQDLLRRNPQVTILCLDCGTPVLDAYPDSVQPVSEEEIVQYRRQLEN